MYLQHHWVPVHSQAHSGIHPQSHWSPCTFTGIHLYSHGDPCAFTGISSLHRKPLLNPYVSQFPSLPSNLSVFLTSSFSVFCLRQILSPTLMGPVPSLIHKCLSQTRSGHLRLTEHHPTNAAQPTHPSHSDCSFQSPRFTLDLASIFRTVSHDPVLKHHIIPFPVLVVYWRVFSKRTLKSHSHVTQVTQSQSILVISALYFQSLSSRHIIPPNGSYCHQLSWALTPNLWHPGFPVPVVVIAEKCALATQPNVPQSLKLDYTKFSPCIGHVMIAANHKI